MGLVGGDAEQAEFPHLPPQRHRKGIVAVDLVGKRRDSLAREPAHALAQRIDLLAEGEVQASFEHFRLLPALHDLPIVEQSAPANDSIAFG